MSERLKFLVFLCICIFGVGAFAAGPAILKKDLYKEQLQKSIYALDSKVAKVDQSLSNHIDRLATVKPNEKRLLLELKEQLKKLRGQRRDMIAQINLLDSFKHIVEKGFGDGSFRDFLLNATQQKLKQSFGIGAGINEVDAEYSDFLISLSLFLKRYSLGDEILVESLANFMERSGVLQPKEGIDLLDQPDYGNSKEEEKAEPIAEEIESSDQSPSQSN